MTEMLPFDNQPYSDNIFRIVAYKLVDQAPCIVSWILDSIVSKLSNKTSIVYSKDLLLEHRDTLIKSDVVLHYPCKKKVTYFWVFEKLIQLLLWNESKPAKSFGTLCTSAYYYKISMMEISENVVKIQLIVSDYISNITPKSVISGLDNSHPVESSALPSYENIIDGHSIVGTSDSHLNSSTQKDENFSETNVQDYEHNSCSSFPEFKLQYCFSGSNEVQARDFINDYDSLALRNKWSSEDKMEFFPNHLENDALNWYLSIQEHLTSWKIVKMEFMQKYLAN